MDRGIEEAQGPAVRLRHCLVVQLAVNQGVIKSFISFNLHYVFM